MRLIDADALKEQFPSNDEEPLWHYTGIRAAIDVQPTVDAVPVNHAKWIHHLSEKEWDVCTKCEIGTKRREITVSYITEYSYRYCPNCGSKMDVEE